VRAELGEGFTPVVADAADPVVAGQLIDAHQPRTIVLNAGARPLTRPIHQHTWETFSRIWHVDVQQVFNWTRQALLRPLVPGSTVIAFSSGAAVAGSPLSGGYAGAKAAIGFIASYAATGSERAELGIKFTAVLPQLTPATNFGAAAYAARQGLDLVTALERFGPALTPEQVGKAMVELATDPNHGDTAYLLTTAGLATAS
jgi:NADP-dependent 3-hydroxy acid dehydrogenase YdfG